ncbi:type III-B CRISPR-associated protein Cas10/Cmr2 [Neisseria sp. HMSC070E12]|uniref:type III-B CRISPR-associated protein Cas10/Cmr2 n=1 Tax=Neisseria mucosa TaxID=488 RepID=UPI0008A35AE0|nr:type III-B CRISPR-associated protein Cas10/Cmr2 [Neisseria mucosa]OFN05572.1 type III-B CRISPR-associated protein Cas10/Cmr2 [Neisseria sp. HMSC055F11]OHR42937.1 type III-B CRISPR-associated protein Cas10/Cmr2 [Neisseria sp. HMSC070E12]
MTQYVLTLSIGPVQEFIASARRSRDLWSGSWLLSEMAKAAAKSLFEAGAQMVFPFVDEATKDRLEPCDRMDDNFSVGNKIQVQVDAADDADVRDLVEQAKAAAQSRFETIARQALRELQAPQDLNVTLRNEIWQMQLNDYLEIQATWARITEKGYSDASQRAASALTARKATRDFTPAHAADAWDKRFMLPKSSLDGARETVLLEKANGDADLSDVARRKLGLSRSEQLDCAGIVKRLGGNSEQFTPVTRVAADAWLQGLPENELSNLCNAYEPLIELNLATRVKGNQGIYADFPFDAQLLYRNRLDAALSDNKNNADVSEKLSNLKNALKPIWHKYGEPCSYWAMLLADGDRMGELLDKAKTIEEHQGITEALSTFAESVPAKMRDFRAQCVYAGGDDVLGFVALDKAVDCADALRQAFSACLKKVSDVLKAEKTPTLSVGLAICHISTPLGNVRRLAKHAEKVAKGDNYSADQQRNGLGITLSVRSGSDSDWRVQWSDEAGLAAFEKWKKWYREKKISSRIAYDSRDIFMRTDFSPSNDLSSELHQNIRQAEFARMLDKARDMEGGKLDDEVQEALKRRLNARPDADALNVLATELIIARWLAAKTQNDLGQEAQS